MELKTLNRNTENQIINNSYNIDYKLSPSQKICNKNKDISPNKLSLNFTNSILNANKDIQPKCQIRPIILELNNLYGKQIASYEPVKWKMSNPTCHTKY